MLLAGLLCGALSAALAVLPALLATGGGISVGAVILPFAAVAVSGWLWTWGAARLALRGSLLEALARAE